MIRLVIFDLDGTLVQTERLKALSYARATVELCPYSLDEATVIEAFKGLVGLSRQEVSAGLIEQFDLEPRLAVRRTNPDQPLWQTLVDVRLTYYNDLLVDKAMLRDYQWPHNVGLLAAARADGCQTALATMSHREQVDYVLDVLDLTTAFDLVMTRDDVDHGKPDPEIYNKVLANLGVAADDTLIIEDSANGVRAALASGAHVIAVSTPYTRDSLHTLTDLPPENLVDDPAHLLDVVQRYVKLQK